MSSGCSSRAGGSITGTPLARASTRSCGDLRPPGRSRERPAGARSAYRRRPIRRTRAPGVAGARRGRPSRGRVRTIRIGSRDRLGARGSQPGPLPGRPGPIRLRTTALGAGPEGLGVDAGGKQAIATWKPLLGCCERPADRGQGVDAAEQRCSDGFSKAGTRAAPASERSRRTGPTRPEALGRRGSEARLVSVDDVEAAP